MRKTTVAANKKIPKNANFCLNSTDSSLMKISLILMIFILLTSWQRYGLLSEILVFSKVRFRKVGLGFDNEDRN